MPRLRIVWFGRRARDPLIAAADHYQKRLARYAPIEMLRLKDSTPNGEAGVLLKHVGARDHLVVLDAGGAQLTTADLAGRLQRWQHDVSGTVTLTVGGKDGFDQAVYARANEKLALSRLTLPHRMALVLLLEQLYRAHTILRGEPYHRE